MNTAHPVQSCHFQVYRSVLVRDSRVTLHHPIAHQSVRRSKDRADFRAASRAASLKDADVEHVVPVWFDQQNRVIGLRTVAVGSLTAAIVHPREVFIGTSDGRVSFMIIAHNPPLGDTAPSQEDHALTERLVTAGKILGTPVKDHLILRFSLDGRMSYYSVADEGCLA